jgi:hypothetical protein
MPGVGDEHDDNIFSSLVMAHGGIGTQTIFLAGQGSPIPQLSGTAITAANLPAHYQTYTPLTTVIQQAGQIGNTIGDFSARAIGVTIDATAVNAAGAGRTWGATPFEVVDICSKVRLEVKLATKRRLLSPLWACPQLGGPMGFSVATGQSFVQNSLFATGRRLASRFDIARNDTLTVDVTADAALAFSDTSFATTHTGQATLVWVMMIGSARSDVR